MLRRPEVLLACHANGFCHLGSAKTLRLLEQVCRQIGMKDVICTPWGLGIASSVRPRKIAANGAMAHPFGDADVRPWCRYQC